MRFGFGVTQADIDAYVDGAYENQNSQDYRKYAEVSERLRNDVQADINIDGYAHALRDNDIRHIRNSHGENTQEKYPVTKQDIKKIPWIVENYDKVYAIKRKDGRTGIMYVKVNDQGTVYYLEQVTSKYGNEPLLVNKQMIKTGIGDIPNLPGLMDAITKKQSETEFLNDLQKAQQVYAQSVHQSHSNSRVTQPGVDVKQQFALSGAEKVDTQNSLSDSDADIAPLPWNIKGEDVAYIDSTESNPMQAADQYAPVIGNAAEAEASNSLSSVDNSENLNYDSNITETEGGVIRDEQREETREAFIRRTGKTLPEIGERGTLAFGCKRYSGQLSQNTRAAEEGLKKLGIPVVVYEQLEGNKKIRGQCYSIDRSRVRN